MSNDKGGIRGQSKELIPRINISGKRKFPNRNYYKVLTVSHTTANLEKISSGTQMSGCITRGRQAPKGKSLNSMRRLESAKNDSNFEANRRTYGLYYGGLLIYNIRDHDIDRGVAAFPSCFCSI